MRRILTILTLLLLGSAALTAQDRKLVTGRILDMATDLPIDLSQVEVLVYSFNTVAEAEDVKKQMDEDANAVILPEAVTYPDQNGYYQIYVASTGALVFKADMQEAVVEHVDNRLEIDVKISLGNRIRNSLISAKRENIGVMEPESDIDGNWLKARSSISLPEFAGKANARLIIQPFLVDCESKDTLRYLRPIVLDGKEYVLTQLRRKNYDPALDTLNTYRLKDENLSARETMIPWADTIFLEHPERSYQVKGIIHFEDYLGVYKNNDYYLTSSRIRRPMRFLECPAGQFWLDPNQYKEHPKRERHNTVGKMSLQFTIGKAEIAAADTAGWRQIETWKKTLTDIVNDEGSVLKEFHITGTASPDGPYTTNQKLAQKRLQYAMDHIASVLPEAIRERVYMTTKANVASWSEVADILEQDSLTAEAEEVRRIVNDNPGRQDRQWVLIRRLPYYRTVITERLPRLRNVQYLQIQEVYRELTPDEIMDRYMNDEDYRSGRKEFALYEFWNLFNMVKDKDELYALYKRAYDESVRENGRPWVLAACNLAAADIERGIIDTTLLNPFIDLSTHGVNVKLRNTFGDGYTIVNPAPVVANQMMMRAKAYDFRRASQLCRLLNNGAGEEYSTIKAYVMCLGGYYKGGDTPEQRAWAKNNLETIMQTTSLNRVIANLALDTKHNDAIAESAMAELPADDALTDYLWAVIYGRKAGRSADVMDDIASEDYLVSCFRKDKSYIDIAAGDGDIVEDTYKNAKARYDEEINGKQL